ncbi:MAG: DUF1801 domain-containing protein [Paracoccaceae bacterium]
MAEAQNKTRETAVDPAEFIAGVEPQTRRDEALRLDTIFREVTGFVPRMWGPASSAMAATTIVTTAGAKAISWPRVFHRAKAAISIYIMPGYADFGDILAGLGKHRMGKSCLLSYPAGPCRRSRASPADPRRA